MLLPIYLVAWSRPEALDTTGRQFPFANVYINFISTIFFEYFLTKNFFVCDFLGQNVILRRIIIPMGTNLA